MPFACSLCHGGTHASLANSVEPVTGEPICEECLERELRCNYLSDLDSEELRVLLGRVNAALRKHRSALVEVGAMLGARGLLSYDDLL